MPCTERRVCRGGYSQIVGDRFWFGKYFYDGEGTTGVGGFGYFGTGLGKFALFSSSEIADWSVGAILVEGNEVWLALSEFTEGYGRTGGLLRWDISTGNVRRFDSAAHINQIIRYGSRLFLATDLGFAILHDGRLQDYAIDKAAGGSYRVVPVKW